jgi:hypothetical protein
MSPDKPIYHPPDITILNDSEFMLTKRYVFEWTEGNDIWSIQIPEGFVTDGASVPRFCWSLTGLIPTGVHLGAAVVHDYLYQHRGLLVLKELLKNGEPVDAQWDRPACDDIFKRIMVSAGETHWKTYAMFWAVRAFGKAAWDR